MRSRTGPPVLAVVRAAALAMVLAATGCGDGTGGTAASDPTAGPVAAGTPDDGSTGDGSTGDGSTGDGSTGDGAGGREAEEGGSPQQSGEEGGGALGAPDGGGGVALGAPVRVPRISEADGAPLGYVLARLEASMVEVCGGPLCVDLVVTPDPGDKGEQYEECQFTGTLPAAGGEVGRGGTVQVLHGDLPCTTPSAPGTEASTDASADPSDPGDPSTEASGDPRTDPEEGGVGHTDLEETDPEDGDTNDTNPAGTNPAGTGGGDGTHADGAGTDGGDTDGGDTDGGDTDAGSGDTG